MCVAYNLIHSISKISCVNIHNFSPFEAIHKLHTASNMCDASQWCLFGWPCLQFPIPSASHSTLPLSLYSNIYIVWTMYIHTFMFTGIQHKLSKINDHVECNGGERAYI